MLLNPFHAYLSKKIIWYISFFISNWGQFSTYLYVVIFVTNNWGVNTYFSWSFSNSAKTCLLQRTVFLNFLTFTSFNLLLIASTRSVFHSWKLVSGIWCFSLVLLCGYLNILWPLKLNLIYDICSILWNLFL